LPRRWWTPPLCAAGLVVASSASSAFAQAPPPAERATVYSPYELETIGRVFHTLNATVDPAPEGKTIERVDVIPIDVFEDRDFLPLWLNTFHATTRPTVIRQEMLLHEGDRYKQVLADDTLRNLRHLVQLSLVLVIAAKGSRDDTVRVVVITKDVWSLRLSWDIVADAGGLDELSFQPSEQNVAGIHHVASGLFILDPSTVTLGGGYEIPRFRGTRVALDANADVIVNRASGSTEGSAGSVLAGQPLYSGLVDWAWNASAGYANFIARRFVNGAPSQFVDVATGQTVPNAYSTRTFSALYEGTRSFGWDVKHDITFGASIGEYAYHPAFTADPRTTADFTKTYVPSDDARIGPFVQYHTYTKRYVRLVDFESLSLQEDASLGHDAIVRVFPSFHALGGDRDVVAIYAAAQYSVAIRDGFFRTTLATMTEPEPSHIGNAAISPSAHLVTPTVFNFGRLVADGTMLYRWRDELNITGACPGLSVYAPFTQCSTFLGGSNRLRGYPTNFFVGKSFTAYNLELRTRPVEVFTLQLAGTLFYDAGSAFDDIARIRTFQSVGFGFRALFNWLDREVFSVDIGFPVERPIDPSTGSVIPPYGFVVTFGQAFEVPRVAAPSLLPTGQAAW
jgi:hypothetical protein